MAIELLTAQHSACEVIDQLNQIKGELAEAKMRQQMRLSGALDAQLQAAHAAIDASAATTTEWRTGAEALLQKFASCLSGACQIAGDGPFTHDGLDEENGVLHRNRYSNSHMN